MVTLTIDNMEVTVPKGATILEAARSVGINIPTLCEYQPLNHKPGSCRVCVVEVTRSRSLVASCVHPVADGMVVQTNTARVRNARRTVMEMLLSDHPDECTTCRKAPSCELKALAETLGVERIRVPETDFSNRPIDRTSPSLVRDPAKCINCGRCVVVCDQVQTVSLLTPKGRGFESKVVPAMDGELADAVCTYCGQCAVVCPTGAIVEKDDTDEVWSLLDDKKKHVVVQEAPAVRAQLGESFGMPAGSLVTGKMISALKRLGFDKVFDTNFAADVTIMEEGNELLHRLETGGTLPLITSCSPGWIKFIEHFYPSLLGNISSCKSPQQMFGALAKTYYAETAGIDPADIGVVSVMPCTAKKFEATRDEMCDSGYRDVDAVLTTRELARMIKEAGIDFETLPEGEFSSPMGMYTGAATIFGATGGVMEAALRTVFAVVTGEKMPDLNITPVRGLAGVKTASMVVEKLGEVRVAVVSGLGNVRPLLDQIAAGDSPYHFIEVMACRGGCVGGGGQPLPTNDDTLRRRAEALYTDDESVQELRQSHENPAVQQLYDAFLGKPLGEKSHALLHTKYVKRGLGLKPKNKG
jgi:iron-only hydrogenase group A